MRLVTWRATPETRRWTRPARCGASGGRPLALELWTAAASTGRSLGGGGPPGRRAPGDAAGVDAAEEAPQEPVDLLGALDLGRVTAAVEHDVLGRRQPALHMPAEDRRDELVVRGPHEHGGRLQGGQAWIEAVAPVRGVEVDVARGGQEGQARAGRSVDPLELVDDHVGHRGIDQV